MYVACCGMLGGMLGGGGGKSLAYHRLSISRCYEVIIVTGQLAHDNHVIFADKG